MGRYLADGNIEFLGREDFQVKVRGHRIELGEIEQTLLQHPEVQAAVASVITEPDGEKRLVAYVVLQLTQPEETRSAVTFISLEQGQRLRRFLNEKLPASMVPSTILVLDQLPLTANGKVDRRALPVPDAHSTEGRTVEGATNHALTAPRTPIEERVGAIWCEVLGHPQIGLHDDFFALGGHSLLAIRLVSCVKERFQIGISLSDLFEAPTVAEMARCVEDALHLRDNTELLSEGLAQVPPQNLLEAPKSSAFARLAVRKRAAQTNVDEGETSSLPQVKPDPEHRYEPFPTTDLQQAYWVGRTEKFASGNVATHSYLEYESNQLDLERLERAWNRLIKRHEMLRAVMLPNSQQCILPETPFYRIAVSDMHVKTAEEVETEILAIRQRLSHQVRNLCRDS